MMRETAAWRVRGGRGWRGRDAAVLVWAGRGCWEGGLKGASGGLSDDKAKRARVEGVATVGQERGSGGRKPGKSTRWAAHLGGS